MTAAGPILFCYDGSEGARAALEQAAAVFGVKEAVVACYWQPFERDGRFRVEILELVQDAASITERERTLAEETAAEGAALARELGFDAEAEAIRIDGPIEEAILMHADRIEAATIVLGARKHSRLRSLLVGNVANEVLQRSTRPVFLAALSGLAERRREELLRETEPAEVGNVPD